MPPIEEEKGKNPSKSRRWKSRPKDKGDTTTNYDWASASETLTTSPSRGTIWTTKSAPPKEEPGSWRRWKGFHSAPSSRKSVADSSSEEKRKEPERKTEAGSGSGRKTERQHNRYIVFKGGRNATTPAAKYLINNIEDDHRSHGESVDGGRRRRLWRRRSSNTNETRQSHGVRVKSNHDDNNEEGDREHDREASSHEVR